MALRHQRPLTFQPTTVSDAIDGTNSPQGALRAAANLIPSMHTRGVKVCRPAANRVIDLGPDFVPDRIEVLAAIGNRVYGMAASTQFQGKSASFCYDFSLYQLVSIAGVELGNLPDATKPPPGDWIPPTAALVGAYLFFSHPGFMLPHALGWLDMTGLVDGALGDTGFVAEPGLWGGMLWGSGLWGGTSPAGGPVIANLRHPDGTPKNVLLAGWRPGMLVTDSAGRIPAGTRIAGVAVNGLSIMLTQSVAGAPLVGVTLSVQGGTPANPLWASGNLNVHPLPGVARAVKQFNGRLECAVGNADVFSDAGDPLQRTNASQSLTLQNGLPITALATLPLNTLTGGIVQSLLLIQSDEHIAQVTGDPATGNLALNENLSTIGTLAPNAIVSTPMGLGIIAPDGLRIIDQNGNMGEPIGANGDGVALPFVNTIHPSRIAAAYNEDVIRVACTHQQTVAGAPAQGLVTAEYWFHLKLREWSGPHTFTSALIVPSSREYTNHGYLSAPNNLNPGETGIWFSTTRPMAGTSYIENGQPLYWLYQTSLLPDTRDMRQNSILQATVAISLPVGTHADVDMVDESGNLIDHATVAGLPQSEWGNMVWGQGTWGSRNPPPSKWGKFVWGAGRWGGEPNQPPGIWGQMVWGQSVWGSPGGGGIFAQRPIMWDMPLVFKQGSVLISGKSAPEVAIGNLYMLTQRLGYTITDILNVTE